MARDQGTKWAMPAANRYPGSVWRGKIPIRDQADVISVCQPGARCSEDCFRSLYSSIFPYAAVITITHYHNNLARGDERYLVGSQANLEWTKNTPGKKKTRNTKTCWYCLLCVVSKLNRSFYPTIPQATIKIAHPPPPGRIPEPIFFNP